VQTQSYGAEARGSAAKSEIIISDGKIGFPFVRKCDILVAMSQEALDKNIADLKGNGLLLIDNLLVKNVPKVNAKIYAAPATQIAEDVFKNRLYANMVILGVLNTLVNLVRNESMEDAIRDAVTSGAVIINLEAYKKGRNLAASYRTI
jgi:2-oxoglutarate ferredoxin oxidoreductase subunit gamma